MEINKINLLKNLCLPKTFASHYLLGTQNECGLKIESDSFALIKSWERRREEEEDEVRKWERRKIILWFFFF